MKEIKDALLDEGVTAQTLSEGKKGASAQIYGADPHAVERAAKRLGGSTTAHRGTGEFVPENWAASREEAVNEARDIVRSYEQSANQVGGRRRLNDPDLRQALGLDEAPVSEAGALSAAVPVRCGPH